MIPIKDNLKTRTFPIITACFIFVNILIFLWQRFTLTTSENEFIFKYYGLIPYDFWASLSLNHNLIPYNIMTIFTSMFLHGGILHVGGNMLYMLIFGKSVEDSFGHKRFFLFYFLSGITASIFQLLYDPQSKIPMVGASGAISGILGAYLILFPRAKIVTMLIIIIFIKFVQLPAVLLLTVWFFIQVLYSHTEGVAWYAHIGGFIFGLLTARWFSRKRQAR
ncbi:MAG TPA: rhomboid family intramembrane serine protease [Syntrophorhabdaceae bacterium]|nr:rhomboid family intramembrane serine protease [Syntrophorhabdaceae bacterium]